MQTINTLALSKHISKHFKLKSKDVLGCIKEFVENSESEGIVIVTNYSNRSAALFGNTKSVWNDLKELNGEKKKVVTFNSKLEFGPGIVVTGKYLEEVKEFLDEKEIEYEEKKKDQYEKEFKGEESPEKEKSKTKTKKETSKTKVIDYKKMTIKLLKEELTKRGLKTTGKKDELIERLEGSTEKKSVASKKSKVAKEPAKGKKMPASKSAPKLKAKQNEWGNFEDEETGIVFLKLPVGKDGKDMSVAIGVQNTEVDGQGLETVLPIDDDVIEECKAQKFKMFNESMLKTLKKNDREKYNEIQTWLESVKSEEEEEEEED